MLARRGRQEVINVLSMRSEGKESEREKLSNSE